MKIAYLQTTATSNSGTSGVVHVSQVAAHLLHRGHQLYTNLSFDSPRLTYFSLTDFFNRAHEFDLFYVRIQGVPFNDQLTLLRHTNYEVPCIWEINAPLEEMRLRGVSDTRLLKLNQLRKSLARLVDGAICVSEEMARYAKQDLEIKNCVVIPNGSDPELFNPVKKSPSLFNPDQFIVLWAGSPKYSWQGLEIVQKVAARIQSAAPDILFAVTAEGKSHGNMLYLGRIPYNVMPRYMASVDVGLCIYEPIDFYKEFFFSPLKLYDYMACGLPVIGTGVGQIKDVIEQAGNGLLTDNSIKEIVEKILFLKRNRQVAIDMGRKGRQAVEEIYNWARIAEKSEKFMEETQAVYRKPRTPLYPFNRGQWLLWKLRYRFVFNFVKPMVKRLGIGGS